MRKGFNGFIFVIVLIFFLITPSNLFQQTVPPYQALIIELQGKVHLKKAQSNEFNIALWGMQVFTGDMLKTEQDAQVSLLFSNNSLITLGPNSTMTISNNTFNENTKSPSIKNVDSEMLAGLSILSLQETSNGEMGLLAGLRSDNSETLNIITPRNSKILNMKPVFEWTTSNKFEQFKISLFDENGLLWTKNTKSTTLNFPGDESSLKGGHSYFWFVEGEGLFESTKSKRIGFQIVTRENIQSIQKQIEEIQDMLGNNQDNDSYLFIMGNLFKKEGFIQEAISNFSKIANKNPSAPAPHQILGNLYNQIGLKDQAISELKQAVELSQRRD